MTRKGSLMPSVFFGSSGHEMNVVDTFVPQISSTDDWMSASVRRLMCPFLTCGGKGGGGGAGGRAGRVSKSADRRRRRGARRARGAARTVLSQIWSGLEPIE